MSAITQVKEWCDKTGNEHPVYTYDGSGTEWICMLTAPWCNSVQSTIHASKKLAKEHVAQHALAATGSIKGHAIESAERLCIMIDGDQRVDCWKWLASAELSNNVDVMAFVGPSSYTVECENITIHKAMSTSKDSADALVLITLGKILDQYSCILIVSADHILVQAAMDTENVAWASNLKEMKLKLCVK